MSALNVTKVLLHVPVVLAKLIPITTGLAEAYSDSTLEMLCLLVTKFDKSVAGGWGGERERV